MSSHHISGTMNHHHQQQHSAYEASSVGDGASAYSHHDTVVDQKSLQEEWQKLKVLKRKMQLKQEKLALDLEMLKAERQKMKISNKFSKKLKEEEFKSKEAGYQEKIALLEAQLASSSLNHHPPTFDDSASREEVRHLQQLLKEREEEYSEEISSFEDLLMKTQTGIAEGFQQKMELENECETLRRQLQEAQSKNELQATPGIKSAETVKLHQKIQELTRDLQLSKSNAQEQAQKLAETERLNESLQNQVKDLSSNLESATQLTSLKALNSASNENDKKFERIRKENETIKQQWQVQQELASRQNSKIAELTARLEAFEEEKKILTKQLEERNRQIEDFKISAPRNKVLLEQEQQNTQDLERSLAEVNRKLHEQEELLDESTKMKEALLKQRDRHQTEFRKLETDLKNISKQKAVLEDCLKQATEGGNTPTVPTSLDILIPSDVTASKVKKHVIEHEWTGVSAAGFYTGWLDESGNPDGHGTLRLADGSIYDGSWTNGTRTGHGVYSSVDGDFYRGTWKDCKPDGRGVFIWEDGRV